jgi:chromosome segregation ATPase
MTITRDQIYAVANTLNSQGTRPTLAAIRRLLGAGSFTTISEALNEWKMLQSKEAASNQIKEAPPESFGSQLQAFGASLWSDALALASARFKADRDAMDEKNREKEEYYQNLNELTEEYDKELEGAKACIEELREALNVANQRATQFAEEIQQARQAILDSEKEREIMKNRTITLQIEVDRAHQEREQSQKGFIHLTERLETMQTLLLDRLA